MPDAATGPLAPFAGAPGEAVVAVDFDGTLAPIVDDPALARPLDGVADVLGRLAGQVREVAVVSGRPAGFLVPHVPVAVTVVGLYGLEVVRQGRLEEHPEADRWRSVLGAVATEAEATAPDGLRVERKGLSLTLHYRGRPELSAAATALADRLGAGAGLSVRSARMSVELHPPVDEDKGTVLRRLAGPSGPVMFVGDDLGDLPAFDALDTLAAAGRPVLRVAVASDESPPGLRERADLVVDGPAGAAALLADLSDLLG